MTRAWLCPGGEIGYLRPRRVRRGAAPPGVAAMPRVLAALLLAALLGALVPALAAAAESPAPADTAAGRLPGALDEARERIRNGDNDRAIEILKGVVATSHGRADRLREAYLLLITTYVYLGNESRFRSQGREQSRLWYAAAEEQITEALRTPGLRHLRPEPESDYPPEMNEAFRRIRSQIFGSVRVASLDPPGAVVLLDGDTLGTFPGDSLPGDVDLAVGPHRVVVRHPGHQEVVDQITIAPNTTLQLGYRLSRRRGPMWYASRVTGVAGVLGGVIALVSSGRGSSTQPPEQPLPEPPGPPSR